MTAGEGVDLRCSNTSAQYTKCSGSRQCFSAIQACIGMLLSRAANRNGEERMEIRTDFVNLSVTDGTSMRAYVARPEGAAGKNGLIVVQEAFGVNSHIRDVAERFAREGYVAIAPELFHRSAPGFDCRYDDFPTAMGQLQKLKTPEMEADMRAAYDWLRKDGLAGEAPISAVGFCVGGRVAFLSALTLPLSCAVSFYGGGIAPSARGGPGLLGRVNELARPMLLFWGGRDQHIGPEQMNAVTDALRAAGKSFVNVEFSEADHGFFCDARPSYNPVAAAQAWPLTLAFLKTHTSGRERAVPASS
jgi:carboxymethylenebutenolidase